MKYGKEDLFGHVKTAKKLCENIVLGIDDAKNGASSFSICAFQKYDCKLKKDVNNKFEELWEILFKAQKLSDEVFALLKEYCDRNEEENIFAFVKSKVGMADVLGEYALFEKEGEYLVANCPFHCGEEKTFRAHVKKGIFYCFECHEGGDIVSLVSKMEDCSQYGAAELIKANFIDKTEKDYE